MRAAPRGLLALRPLLTPLSPPCGNTELSAPDPGVPTTSGPDAYVPVSDPAGYCSHILALSPGGARCIPVADGHAPVPDTAAGAEGGERGGAGEGRAQAARGKHSRKRGRPKALDAVLEELRGGSRASALRVARAVHAVRTPPPPSLHTYTHPLPCTHPLIHRHLARACGCVHVSGLTPSALPPSTCPLAAAGAL